MSTLGIDLRINRSQLQDAKKSVTDLKKELNDITQKQHKVNIEMPGPAISDEAFQPRATSAAIIEKQNRLIQQTLRDIANESRKASGFKDGLGYGRYAGYRIGPPGGGEEGGGSSLSLGRLGKAGLALGGLSAGVGFLLNSRKQFQELVDIEAVLATRGAGYDRGGSPYGYGPAAEAEMAMALNRSSGYLGNGAARSVQRFARATGTDASVGIGFMGEMYRMTGADADKQGRFMDVLVSLKENSKDKRTEEILKLINSNLMTLFSAQGNKALTDSQISGVMATTLAMYNRGGTAGNSPEMFNTMQGALRFGGGDTVGDLLRWKIMGGNDGPMTADKLLEMQRRQQMGLLDPAMRDEANRVIGSARSRAEKNILIQRMLPGGIDIPANQQIADAYLDLFGPGGKLTGKNDPKQQSKVLRDYISGKRLNPAIQLEVEKLLGVYSQTAGSKISQRHATRETTRATTGENLEEIFGQWEDMTTNTHAGVLNSGLLKDAAKFVNKSGADFVAGVRGHRMDPVFIQMGKKYNLDPSLLKGIAEVESQFNYKARSPKGAQGIMQLMPQTAKYMGVKDPFNPVQSIEGGAKYLRSLLDRYNGDTDKALAAYNWGPGNVDRSGVMSLPAETRTYLGKVKGAQLRYGSTEANLDPTAPSGGPGISDTSFLGWPGLFRRAVECLEQLVTNTTPGMPRQTPLSGSEK
ncbi:lytic transglycosylase domain-containing protein [Geobacter anodireducens]|uniref:lytic transglycosylase domain-containing protein n=1 Tax=Geobacter soli TaxID=1510391 RepID=UPI0006922CFA|nr:lytic transglycosylase domain-containing protein [Geobacter soli]